MQRANPSLVKKLFKHIRERGVGGALCSVRNYFKPAAFIARRRKELSNQLANQFNDTVAYGPFKGFKLNRESWWNEKDKGAMLLGLYEQEVLTSLTDIPATHRTFIDLGAADGYYGVGVLAAGLFDRSYCFEMSEQGRAAIKANAQLNGVSDKLIVHGTADKRFYEKIPAQELSRCVLFIDIEGAEFDLLDEKVLEKFKDAIIFIELHHWFYADGQARLAKLREAASKHFKITELTTTSRDLSIYPELQNYTDDDRWLLASEGRKKLMTWWRLNGVRRAYFNDLLN